MRDAPRNEKKNIKKRKDPTKGKNNFRGIMKQTQAYGDVSSETARSISLLKHPLTIFHTEPNTHTTAHDHRAQKMHC